MPPPIRRRPGAPEPFLPQPTYPMAMPPSAVTQPQLAPMAPGGPQSPMATGGGPQVSGAPRAAPGAQQSSPRPPLRQQALGPQTIAPPSNPGAMSGQQRLGPAPGVAPTPYGGMTGSGAGSMPVPGQPSWMAGRGPSTAAQAGAGAYSAGSGGAWLQGQGGSGRYGGTGYELQPHAPLAPTMAGYGTGYAPTGQVIQPNTTPIPRGSSFADRMREASTPFVGPTALSTAEGASGYSAAAPPERRERPAAAPSAEAIAGAVGDRSERADASTRQVHDGEAALGVSTQVEDTDQLEDLGWREVDDAVRGMPVWQDPRGQTWAYDEGSGTVTRVDTRGGYDPYSGNAYVGWTSAHGPGRPPREGEQFTNPDNGISWTYIRGNWERTDSLQGDDALSEPERENKAWREGREKALAAARSNIENGYQAEQLNPLLLEKVLGAQRTQAAQATGRATRGAMLAAGRTGVDAGVSALAPAELYQNQQIQVGANEAGARMQFEMTNLQMRAQMLREKLSALTGLDMMAANDETLLWAANQNERTRQEAQDLQLQMAALGAKQAAEAQAAASRQQNWSTAGNIIGGLIPFFGAGVGAGIGAIGQVVETPSRLP
jgi:hypothetical protein